MKSARLTYASTHHSSDALYTVGMTVEDAFAAWEFNGKRYAIASSLELGNFTKYSQCDKVFSLEDLKKKTGDSKGLAPIIVSALKTIGAKRIVVGPDFPAKLLLELKRLIPVSFTVGPLFPERAVKTEYEQNEIRKANKACAAGIALCGEYIRKSKVSKGNLVFSGKRLTSEFLRTRVQELFLQMGLMPVSELIISGGHQACDPHCSGSGPLRAKELIIVDLFSPLQKSNYWGDMTRTFIKGQPTDAQRNLVEAVAFAQREAILAIKPGINGTAIQSIVVDYFNKSGHKTYKTKNGYEGFYYGTGHGLGLDCHDLDLYGYRINAKDHILRTSGVYTVEPWLSYLDIGACRIEDNGVVTKDGFKLLSKAPYDWVL